MGGPLSTRWEGESVRPTTDEALRLDVRWLARHDYLVPGARAVVRWDSFRRSDRVAVMAYPDRVVLEYAVRDRGGAPREVQEVLPLTSTPCRFGGSRPWFRCPSCGQRVGVVYGRTGGFRCRRCHDLAFASTREPAWLRAHRKAQRLRARLGLGAGPGEAPARLPASAHLRLLEELARLDEAAGRGIQERVDALQRQLDRLLGRQGASG